MARARAVVLAPLGSSAESTQANNMDEEKLIITDEEILALVSLPVDLRIQRYIQTHKDDACLKCNKRLVSHTVKKFKDHIQRSAFAERLDEAAAKLMSEVDV